ncbi:hypothetical protein SDC9_200167 [bioreactor metagenome]|uniref:Uncharacterized protein n=1 Tax=bioreactor metagenome TaxID=1076179 RepID=A0A645IME8_9ZZZZ
MNTPGAGFWSYGDANRGVRLIELNEDDTSTYDTSILTYHELYEGNKAAELRFKAYANEYSTSERIMAGIQYVFAKISGFISEIF